MSGDDGLARGDGYPPFPDAVPNLAAVRRVLLDERPVDLPEALEALRGQAAAEADELPPVPPQDERDTARDFGGGCLSHDALALEMGRLGWDRDARYVATWGRWLFWTGTHWRRDETLAALTRVRDFLRARADEVLACATNAERKRAKAKAEEMRSAGFVAAVQSLARANPRSAAQVDDFDGDLMLLGTPEGTVDLRSGRLLPPRREDGITKLTAVGPAEEGAEPERWLSFLREVFDGDQVIIDFIQRACGYALTGHTTEHKLLFFYGTGRNGKSVFMDTLAWLLNDYARKAPAETFLNSNVERHSTDIASLQGARLVVASELPRGKTWNEGVIKDLTGGGKMSARYMRQDFFEFEPQLTLMIAGNTMPSFRGIDEAIRARMVLVPFKVTIPAERRDPRLMEKLRAEGPAILRWCLHGVDMWQRRGLDVPPALRAASTEYFEAEDVVGLFLADEVEVVEGAFSASQDLHARFSQWAEKQGLGAWTQTTLIKELRGRGFTDAKGTGGKRGLKGLRLKM